MFSAKRFFSKDDGVSDAVCFESMVMLYGTLVPIAFVAVAQAIVGGITTWQTGDPATAALTIAGVIVSVARILGVQAYRRRVVGSSPIDRTEAANWEWRYISGSFISALILGLFAARGMILDDAICMVMAIGIAFGFGAGVVARLALCPRAAIVSLLATGLPAIAVTLMHPDVRHVGLGLLFTMFLAVSMEMVRLTYKSTVGQITLKQQFEQLARLDPMTGVFNRSVLTTDLADMVARQGTGVAILAIDLDHFKAANDRFGHPVGDALLKQVTERLQSIARPGDLIVRMGGDEFVLAQKRSPGCDDTEAVARQICDAISAPYHVGGHDIVIGVSVGVAMSPDDGQSVEALLARSDSALYRAKRNRGGHAFADNRPPTVTDEPYPAAARERAA
ncbi:MAG: GGDEF domain-containing protein [Pseudomonadota bacterium]